MKNKSFFPTLKLNRNIYFDNAGSSLKLKSVINVINHCNNNIPFNSHSFSNNKTHDKIIDHIKELRILVSNWINCFPSEISLMPSSTYSLNVLALSISKILRKKDEIFISKIDHNSNVYPWISICKEKKSNLRYLPINNSFSIDENEIYKEINVNTKIVSLVHVSNNLGIVNNIEKITKLIKKKNPNCFVIVDASQSITFKKIDVYKWGIDALVFSSNKIYGPTGISILWTKKNFENKIPHLLWGGGKKMFPDDKKNLTFYSYEKFEVGSVPLPQILGLKEVFLFFKNINFEGCEKKYINLKKYTVKEMKKLGNIVFYGENFQSNILLFNVKDFHSHDVSSYLARNNVFIRGGNFCWHFINDLIGVNSTLRISFAIYNTKKEVDKLINLIKEMTIDKLIF